jgi:iron complex transport system substrate-binding protein
MRLAAWLLLVSLPASTAAAEFMDDLGRQVMVPERPTRVVSLAPHLAELMYAAGAGDRLAGVVAFSDYPTEVQALPSVGDAFSLDHEQVARIRPDLILAWAGGNPRQLLERLSRDGYAVVALAAADLEHIGDQIEQLGALMGTEGPARRAAEAYRTELAALSREATGDGLPVFVQVAQDPLYTVGGPSVISDVLRRCGARNIFDDLALPAAQVSYEVVLERAPAMIVASVHDPSEDWRAIWRRWPELAAVSEDRLIGVPADLLSRPTPRLLEGMATICEAVIRP